MDYRQNDSLFLLLKITQKRFHIPAHALFDSSLSLRESLYSDILYVPFKKGKNGSLTYPHLENFLMLTLDFGLIIVPWTTNKPIKC